MSFQTRRSERSLISSDIMPTTLMPILLLALVREQVRRASISQDLTGIREREQNARRTRVLQVSGISSPIFLAEVQEWRG